MIVNLAMMELFNDEMNTELSPENLKEVRSSMQNLGVNFIYEQKLKLKQ